MKLVSRFLKWSFGVVTLGIVVLSLYPRVPNPMKVAEGDKIGHLVAYGIWGGLLFALLAGRTAAAGLKILLIIVAAFLFGGLIELLQPFVGRSCEGADLIANCSGAMIGGIVLLLTGERL